MRPTTLFVVFLLTLPARAAPKIERHVCPNGLEVLVSENHDLPLLTVEIAAKNGSMTESPEYNGLSHLYEHMFFKANAALPSQEAFLARSRELGIVWNGTTNTERVNYFFTTTSDHAKDAMVFMRDAIVSPLFDEKELERERVVVTGEIDRNEADPRYHFWHTVEQHVWWKYPSYKDPLGNRKTVLAATRKQMQTIKGRYYVPNNSALVVTGDVYPPDVFSQADEIFAVWKRGPDPFVAHPLVKHPPLRKTEVVLVEQPVQTVSGAIAWHGPSTIGANIELTYAADALGSAVGEPASTFQKDLVDSGACVHAGFSWFTQKNTGPITLNFEALPDHVDDCVKASLAELEAMRAADYLTDAELEDAAPRHEVREALQRERPSSLSHIITFWWASASLDYYLGYLEHLRRVTRADVARFVDAYVTGRPFVLGIMLSPEVAKERKLDQAHFEALIAGAGGRR